MSGPQSSRRNEKGPSERGVRTRDWDGGVFRVYGAKHKPRTSVRRTLGKTTTNFCPDWFLLFVNGTRVQRKAFYSNARVRARESIHTVLHAPRPKIGQCEFIERRVFFFFYSYWRRRMGSFLIFLTSYFKNFFTHDPAFVDHVPKKGFTTCVRPPVSKSTRNNISGIDAIRNRDALKRLQTLLSGHCRRKFRWENSIGLSFPHT